jgi:hypothetical protein
MTRAAGAKLPLGFQSAAAGTVRGMIEELLALATLVSAGLNHADHTTGYQ